MIHNSGCKISGGCKFSLSSILNEKRELPVSIISPAPFNPFTPRVSYGDIQVILTSESVDEILWCDHSNETSSAVLSHDTFYISVFYKMKFGIRFDF